MTQDLQKQSQKIESAAQDLDTGRVETIEAEACGRHNKYNKHRY
jgi:hypothetical protein